ncbi:transmembrane channel-like protein 7 isoform X2 [Liolophura sinensis]
MSKGRSAVHPVIVRPDSTVDDAIVQRQIEKLSLKGINVQLVEDEEEKWTTDQMIKSLPASLPVKRAVRRKLIDGPVKKVSGCQACKLQVKRSWKKFKIACNELGYKLTLFHDSFKAIEGYQGGGVLSYFVFLKWLLKLNFYIFLLMFLFTTLPDVIFPELDYSSSVTGSSTGTANQNLSITCSALYTVTTSVWAVDNVQDFLQGTGWMEKTEMFFGDYASTELSIGTTSDGTFNYNMPLAFLTVTVVCFLLSLVLMAVHTGGALKETLFVSGGKSYNNHNTVYSGWDYSLSDAAGVGYRHSSLYNEIMANIADAEYNQQRTEHTACSKCKLYTLRVIVNLIVLAILGGGGYLIYYVTSFTTEFTKSSSYTSADRFVQLLVEFLPSLTITGLNVVCPILFGILVKLESYTRGVEIQLMLIRVVFLKMASLAMLVATLYAEITCTPKDSCLVGTSPCTSLKCWETYAGQQFYKLVITDFLVAFVSTFFVEFPRKLIVTKCQCCLSRLIGRQEYDIPKNVLDLVNSQMLLWIGFFFAPLIPAVIVIKLFITFYLKKFSALVNCIPPQRPYKASKSNMFFMVILMFAFFLSCVPVTWSVASLTPSKGCGPFRIYDNMYDIYSVVFATWPSWLQGVMNFLSSAAFVLPLLLFLGLVIYYFRVVANTSKDMVKMLKDQLVLEGHDKQYLMRQLGPQTQGGTRGRTNRPAPAKAPSTLPAPEESKQPIPSEDSWA